MAHETGTESLSFHAKNWSEWQGRLIKNPRRGSDVDFHINIEIPGFRSWEPGQFVMLRWGNHLIGRPFAIFEWKESSSNSSQLHLIVRDAGEGTHEFLKSAQAQHKVWVRGPLGQVPFSADLTKDLSPWIFVSEGPRLAAVFAMLHLRRKLQLQNNLPLDFWWHQDQRSEFMDSEIHARAYVKPDAVGFSESQFLLPENLDLNRYKKIVAAGTSPFLQFWVDQTSKIKNSEIPVWIRKDTPMACGIGLCFSCSVNSCEGPKRSCLEGPWFEWSKLERGGNL